MARKKRSRTPAVIANGLQEIQSAVKKIAHHASTARERFVLSPSPPPPPPTDDQLCTVAHTSDTPCDGDGCVATAQCCQQILQRVVVELALLNLLYNDDCSSPQLMPISGKGLQDRKVAAMAPPPPSGGEPAAPGLLRFMNPVQDLGRSFIGFLLGGAPAAGSGVAVGTGPTVTATAENGRKGAAAGRKRDSVISTTSQTGGGRPRPPGHPANPSSHSTPILIRRTKPDTPPATQHSLGKSIQPAPKDIFSVVDSDPHGSGTFA